MGRHRSADAEGDPRQYDSPTPDRETRRHRRRRGNALLAFATAFAILLGLGVTSWFVLRSGAICAGQGIELEVAVAPELAPVLTELATDFNASDAHVEGNCVSAKVRGVDPANVTYGITGLGPTVGDTDSHVWIPDSSIWVNYISQSGEPDPLQVTGTSVANSPLVLAAPGDGETTEEEPSWQALVPTTPPGTEDTGRDVRLIDPVQSSSGMATLALLNSAILAEGDVEGEAGGDGEEDAPSAASPQFVAALQNLQEAVAPDENGAFGALSGEGEGGEDPMFALSEQAVWRYNNEHSDTPARVSYPAEGTYTLDYPYLLRTGESHLTRAAELFRVHLMEPDAQSLIRDQGFRSEDGGVNPEVFDSDQGFREEPPAAMPTPSSQTLASLTTAWNQLKLRTRLLTLMDISGSMLAEVPGTGATRMQIATAAAIDGLQMFPGDAELGLWEFSENITEDGLDYRETVPIGELDAETNGVTHREALAAQLAATEPLPDGDTGLYDTILAAYREMLGTYRSDRVTTILVLTDGENEKEGGLDLDGLLSTLEEESDPEKPVQIIVISFGPDIDGDPMRQLVEVTGGSAYVTEDPTEIGDIFLEGFALRMASAATEGDG